MDPGVIGVFVPIVAIVGGITLAAIKTMAKARIRELQIRERIAMIEKGLVPPPEVDPSGFDLAMDRHERADWTAGAPRHRRAGITLMGVGFGLMVLIAFAGHDRSSALGVGGFLVVLGAAFFINSLFELRQPPPTPSGPNQLPPPPPAGS
ncbi:MAG: hypothetical protein DMF92_06700 [Acidobacteria bacterium]|nr:MAG: hypothetical protein DMF92_06700 [Acidobacteriota bacterium]